MSINLSAFCERAVFVFGSNRQGIHGAGAAKFAVTYRGAIAGQGDGLQGQSYALPTKHSPQDQMPNMALLRESVARFLDFAASRPDLSFLVTRVGCGLAGFSDAQVAPLFAQAPANCFLPGVWVGRAATIVAGSRGILESETITRLNHATVYGEIVSGMAAGVDRGAVQWAKVQGPQPSSWPSTRGHLLCSKGETC